MIDRIDEILNDTRLNFFRISFRYEFIWFSNANKKSHKLDPITYLRSIYCEPVATFIKGVKTTLLRSFLQTYV